MQLTFTLDPLYTGATYVAGPFNISGTTTGGSTYELANGVTKAQLKTGHTINTTYETLSGGTIQSTGTCSTSQSWSTGIGGGGGGTHTGNALVDFGSSISSSCNNNSQTTVYFDGPNNMLPLQIGDYLYSDSSGTPAGDGYYYKSTLTYGVFHVTGGQGQIAGITNCSNQTP